MIDPALLRPGRFDKIIQIPLPDKESRRQILEINSKEIPAVKDKNDPDYVNLDKIAELTDGMSGADVAAIANTAVSIVIHEYLDKHPTKEELEKSVSNARVTMKHFEESVKKVRTQKDLKIGQKIAVPYYR